MEDTTFIWASMMFFAVLPLLLAWPARRVYLRLLEAQRALKAMEAELLALRVRAAELDGSRGRLESERAILSAELVRVREVLEVERDKGTALAASLEGARAENLSRAREAQAAEARMTELRTRLEKAEEVGKELLRTCGDKDAEAATLRERIEGLEGRAQELQAGRLRIDALQRELREQGEENRELRTRLEEQARGMEERLRAQEELRLRQREDFEGIAAKVLEQNTQKFSGAAQERLGQVSAEMGKAMAELKKKVEEAHSSDARDRVALKTELTRMMEASQQLDTEAKNLTRALSGDRRVQGAWGELTLERLLEQCGLREGHEYEKQTSFQDDEQRRLRPDVVVRLPGDRSVVVDSKVSLTAYNEFVNAASDEEAQQALARHVASVKAHVKNLGSKDYWSLGGLRAGDYVLMFLPIEPAFADALRAAPGLFEEAFKQNIIMTSPCTLLATLRTIEHTWRVERQNETARTIVERAGKLYDKFVGFTEDLQKVGQGLFQAQKAYDGAFNKLSQGRDNLVRQTEKIRELGVKTKKELAAELSTDTFEVSGHEPPGPEARSLSVP